MLKRVMHCVVTAIVCTIIAALLAIAMPHKADALPTTWRGTPVFTKHGVTYRVHDGMHAAVVTRTKGKRVNIPAEIKYHGKWYEVRAIWPGALKGARVVTIHADLETCETARLWSPSVKVRVTRYGMWRWLLRTGANVSKIHCDGCK